MCIQLLLSFESSFLFIYLFLAVLSLCCFTGFSLVVVSEGCSLVIVCGLLISVASVEHRLWGAGFGGFDAWAQEL